MVPTRVVFVLVASLAACSGGEGNCRRQLHQLERERENLCIAVAGGLHTLEEEVATARPPSDIPGPAALFAYSISVRYCARGADAARASLVADDATGPLNRARDGDPASRVAAIRLIRELESLMPPKLSVFARDAGLPPGAMD